MPVSVSVLHSFLRTNRFTRSMMIALMTCQGKIDSTIFRERFIIINFIYTHPGYTGTIIFFQLCRRNIILHGTCQCAITASIASVKINHHSVSRFILIRFHHLYFLNFHRSWKNCSIFVRITKCKNVLRIYRITYTYNTRHNRSI